MGLRWGILFPLQSKLEGRWVQWGGGEGVTLLFCQRQGAESQAGARWVQWGFLLPSAFDQKGWRTPFSAC